MTKNQQIYKLFASMRYACISAEELEHTFYLEWRALYPFADIKHFKTSHPVALISTELNKAMNDLIEREEPIVTDYVDLFDKYFKNQIQPKIDYFMEKNIKI